MYMKLGREKKSLRNKITDDIQVIFFLDYQCLYSCSVIALNKMVLNPSHMIRL